MKYVSVDIMKNDLIKIFGKRRPFTEIEEKSFAYPCRCKKIIAKWSVRKIWRQIENFAFACNVDVF